MKTQTNNIAVYSSTPGVGRLNLCFSLSKSKSMAFVNLDHQNGGSLSDAKTANNAVLYCEPFFEHVLEVVKYTNKLIYILNVKTFQDSPAHCIKTLVKEVEILTGINSDLKVEFLLAENQKWPNDIRSLLEPVITNNV